MPNNFNAASAEAGHGPILIIPINERYSRINREMMPLYLAAANATRCSHWVCLALVYISHSTARSVVINHAATER